MLKAITRTALAAAALTATSAYADGSYVGVGLGYSSIESLHTDPGPGSGASELETAVVGLTTGYRWDLGRGFAAAEVDADFSLDSDLGNTVTGATCPTPGATGAYYCSQNATIRLRGIYGIPVGNNWDVFGTLGYGVVVGQAATGTNLIDRAVTGGLTASLGTQVPVGLGKLRVEVIHDNFTNAIDKPTSAFGTYSPSWEATSLKATFIYSF